jgi:hypothetical protein
VVAYSLQVVAQAGVVVVALVVVALIWDITVKSQFCIIFIEGTLVPSILQLTTVLRYISFITTSHDLFSCIPLAHNKLIYTSLLAII